MNTNINLSSISGAFLAATLLSQAATITTSLNEGANFGSATLTDNTNVGYSTTGDTATKTVTRTTYDFDNDGVNDTFTFDLIATFTEGTANAGFGLFTNRLGSLHTSNGNMESDTGSFFVETGNYNVTLSSGTLTSITFLGFDGINSAGFQAGESYTVNGATYTAGANTFALTQDLDWSVVSGGLRPDTYDYQFSIVAEEAVQVPEPTSATLLGLGGLALLARRKR